MFKTIRKLKRNDSGVTAIEYGLIAGLVSVVILSLLITMGSSLGKVFTTINSGLNKAAGSTSSSGG